MVMLLLLCHQLKSFNAYKPRQMDNIMQVTFKTHFLALVQWGRDKVVAILQNVACEGNNLKGIFFNENLNFRFKFYSDLFLRVQHWFRLWLGAEQEAYRYPNPSWTGVLTYICVTRPQWVKPLVSDSSFTEIWPRCPINSMLILATNQAKNSLWEETMV